MLKINKTKEFYHDEQNDTFDIYDMVSMNVFNTMI